MFGNNPVRKQQLRDDGALYVSEVFVTIQGEGPHAGTPAIFIRLSGCNLQCSFCDTDFESVRELYELEELVGLVKSAHTTAHWVNLVVITGGEPFTQNIIPLVNALTKDLGFTVQIETAGTVSIPNFPWNDVDVVTSPKTGKLNRDILNNVHHYKYIISASSTMLDKHDRLPLLDTGRKIARPEPSTAHTIWIQPMDEQDAALNRQNMNLCIDIAIQRGYRISLQTHKILGVE